MPGSMIHLITANKVKPDGSTLYYLGNIAPDAVIDWHDKDITHFRNLEDRQSALAAFAQKVTNDFSEGVLLHLYLDWKWDTVIRQKYIDEVGDDWFVPYRNELSLSGSYAFHNTKWAKQIWYDMDLIDVSSYGVTPCASVMDVKKFLSLNNKWHNENAIGPSLAFPPNIINEFTDEVAREYIDWRNSKKI